jgi:hypothetical protein
MTELTPVLASLDPSIPPVEHIGYSRAHRAKTSLVGLDYGLYHLSLELIKPNSSGLP